MSNRCFRAPRAKAMALAVACVISSPVLAQDKFDVEQAGASLQLSALSEKQGHDRFIVKFIESENPLQGNPESSAQVFERVGQLAGVGITSLRTLAVGGEVIQLDRALSVTEAEQFMRTLAAQGGVEYVEVDRLNHPRLTPNDPYFNQQWGFGNGAGGIRATQAWDLNQGAGVVVAVLDTGITNHPDLNANVLAGYDFIANLNVAGDGNGRDSHPADPGDYYNGRASSWHGTHVAGTVAAVTNNGIGVSGAAPQARIVPVRVLGRGGGYDSDIADAIVWASGGSVSSVPANANPAEVINMSLGGSGSCGNTYQNAINSAVARGSIVVVAAGNANSNVSNASPANCNNVVAVGSVTSSGARSSFSNYGSGIDIAAPGSSIHSTYNTGSASPGSPTYASNSGTSMAAPHVAGVLALVQSAAPTPLTPAQAEALIKNTARAFPSTPSQPLGVGIINAHAAVQAAQGGGGGGGGSQLQNGVPVTGLSGASGTVRNWTFTVPGSANVTIAISGGSGDADLYVRRGSAPTTSSYECRPYRVGNNETCGFQQSTSTTYHIMLRAYQAYSGVTLRASYN